jgi:hypothetical protein
MIPRPEHDLQREHWPTATLTEARPYAASGALLVPASSAQCWILSTPYRSADVIVIGPAVRTELSRGLDIVVPDAIHAWASTAGGEIETTGPLGEGEFKLPIACAVWLPGTSSEEALTSIGYVPIR